MKLSLTITYAIRATVELAQATPNRPMPCSILAERGKFPERFLLQILRRLVQTDILCSARGVDGGYFLSRHPSEITVLDIVESFEPVDVISPAMPGLAPQSQECLEHTLRCISQFKRMEFKKISIASLQLKDCQTGSKT